MMNVEVDENGFIDRRINRMKKRKKRKPIAEDDKNCYWRVQYERYKNELLHTGLFENVLSSLIIAMHDKLPESVSSADVVCYELLCENAMFSGKKWIFDPIFSDMEKNILVSKGWTLIAENERGIRIASVPTLFYMPHCERELYNNVLYANRHGTISNLVFFGNSFKVMSDSVVEENENLTTFKYLLNASQLAEELPLSNTSSFGEAFYSTCIQYFVSGENFCCQGENDLPPYYLSVNQNQIVQCWNRISIFCGAVMTATFLGRSLCQISSRGMHAVSSQTQMVLRPSSLIITNCRFLPKPGPNIQYKFDLTPLKSMPYTHKPITIRRLGGRNPETGKKVNQRVGGGYNFDWLWISFRRIGPTDGTFYEEKVIEVRRDGIQTAFIALVAGTRGRRWILATENMKAGDVIKTSCHLPRILINAEEGDSWPVGALVPGTVVNSVELYPGCPDERILAKNAGTSVIIQKRVDNRVVILLPNKRELRILPECMATVGRLSNVNRNKQHWGSMNMKRRMGIRQGSGLWHRKDGYCGRKIHPLPPAKTVDGPPGPAPENYSFHFVFFLRTVRHTVRFSMHFKKEELKKAAQSVEIGPKDEIILQAPYDNIKIVEINAFNHSDFHILYKFRTNRPSGIQISPVYGYIKPNDGEIFAAEFLPITGIPPFTDRCTLYCVALPKNYSTSTKPRDMWKKPVVKVMAPERKVIRVTYLNESGHLYPKSVEAVYDDKDDD
ncbi:39S ribosomal protein L2, mitochondrial [Trichinella pseudospiralis]|uniref:39S ribosomal protein L2, mitochondrial n=1 Tax=Trichinella pseudospiralis TaxID=6337 RepID=A0A0V1JPA7_TRIPS|nr:39S ribosomal protein L2, mitochondrial [Trichinella pseudospiralis]